jgi:hypothetical protein
LVLDGACDAELVLDGACYAELVLELASDAENAAVSCVYQSDRNHLERNHLERKHPSGSRLSGTTLSGTMWSETESPKRAKVETGGVKCCEREDSWGNGIRGS